MIGFIFSSQALVDLAVYQNHCFSKLPSSPNNLSHKNQIWDCLYSDLGDERCHNNPQMNHQFFKFSSLNTTLTWRNVFEDLLFLFFIFFSTIIKFWLFYLFQAQFHYGWCRSRDSFSISCPHWWAVVHPRGSVFLLEHQAGLANLLLLPDGYLHHRFAVLFSLWVCLQRSFWIFWSREKNSVLGKYCVDVGGNRCRVLGLFLSTFFLGE